MRIRREVEIWSPDLAVSTKHCSQRPGQKPDLATYHFQRGLGLGPDMLMFLEPVRTAFTKEKGVQVHVQELNEARLSDGSTVLFDKTLKYRINGKSEEVSLQSCFSTWKYYSRLVIRAALPAETAAPLWSAVRALSGTGPPL